MWKEEELQNNRAGDEKSIFWMKTVVSIKTINIQFGVGVVTVCRIFTKI